MLSAPSGRNFAPVLKTRACSAEVPHVPMSRRRLIRTAIVPAAAALLAAGVLASSCGGHRSSDGLTTTVITNHYGVPVLRDGQIRSISYVSETYTFKYYGTNTSP